MVSESVASESKTVGVLALQGDYAEHQLALHEQGLATRQVRTARDLPGLAGLVLPGGESTTMLKLLDVEGLWAPLGAALRSGVPVLATCAGMILLAERVLDPVQRSYGLLPITVVRNGYGRQYHSGTFALQGEALPPGTTGTFIRAPRITAVGAGGTVLATRGADPVLVAAGPIVAACFHPELQAGHPVTVQFAARVRAAAVRVSAAVVGAARVAEESA
jgi:5'-phosphate synthase pdxT subunit